MFKLSTSCMNFPKEHQQHKMALSHDAPTWKVALLITGLVIYDGYRRTRRKANKAYDFLEDKVDETSYLISEAADDALYQTGLLPTSHIP